MDSGVWGAPTLSRCPAAVALAARETKPDCLNSDLALPGILLNARNRRTKAGAGRAAEGMEATMPEGSQSQDKGEEEEQKGDKRRHKQRYKGLCQEWSKKVFLDTENTEDNCEL